jgi:FAD/FMN-containing dehydrogenase
VNYLADDASSAEVASAYGPRRFERLVALKNRYDPSNVFRFNANIAPSPPD